MAATEGFVHPEYRVDTAWLAAHLGDPGVCVIDCTTHLIPKQPHGYDVRAGLAEFVAGHVPGARFVDLQAELSDTTSALRFMTPTPEAFAAAMGRLGITPATRVVFYSTANAWWATRGWWLLRHFGHENAAVLDGGLQKWQAEGRAVATGAAGAVTPTAYPVPVTRGLMVGKDEVLRAVGDGAVCTLNALRPEQHAGVGGVHYGRPGRIKGSVNVPAMHLLDPATNALLPAGTLREMFGAVGALDRPVLIYCGGGIAASADAWALTMLGHDNVRIYDASLSEWVADAALPMETD